MKQLTAAIEAIDALNREDPNAEDGSPKELLYSERMTEELQAYLPDASELLQIAARAQHICRWQIPRDEYPEGRKGYHKWRKACQAMHVAKTDQIMADAGYGEDARNRVAAMLSKDGLGENTDAQVIEDVACLVFLRHYLPAFMTKHSEEKALAILAKTWKKMSAKAQRVARDGILPSDVLGALKGD